MLLRLQQRRAGEIEFQPGLTFDDPQCLQWNASGRGGGADGMARQGSPSSTSCVSRDPRVTLRPQGASQLQRVYRCLPPSCIESVSAASRESHFAVAHLLLECGADVNAVDE